MKNKNPRTYAFACLLCGKTIRDHVSAWCNKCRPAGQWKLEMHKTRLPSQEIDINHDKTANPIRRLNLRRPGVKQNCYGRYAWSDLT